MGTRPDTYHRRFAGQIHEIRVYDGALDENHRAEIEAELANAWGAPLRPSCTRRPCKRNCAAVALAHGLAASDIFKLEKFVAATAAPPLVATLARSFAVQALGYQAAFSARCVGLNNGTVPALRSEAADGASLMMILETGGNLMTGLTNYFQFTVAKSGEAVARLLLAAWSAAAAEVP